MAETDPASFAQLLIRRLERVKDNRGKMEKLLSWVSQAEQKPSYTPPEVAPATSSCCSVTAADPEAQCILDEHCSRIWADEAAPRMTQSVHQHQPRDARSNVSWDSGHEFDAASVQALAASNTELTEVAQQLLERMQRQRRAPQFRRGWQPTQQQCCCASDTSSTFDSGISSTYDQLPSNHIKTGHPALVGRENRSQSLRHWQAQTAHRRYPPHPHQHHHHPPALRAPSAPGHSPCLGPWNPTADVSTPFLSPPSVPDTAPCGGRLLQHWLQLQGGNCPRITPHSPLVKKPMEPAAFPSKNTTASEGLIVGYYLCDDPVPYRTVWTAGDQRELTLGQFKQLIAKRGVYRYFFKRASDEFGTGAVHEELTRDDAVLPLWDGKVFARIERAD